MTTSRTERDLQGAVTVLDKKLIMAQAKVLVLEKALKDIATASDEVLASDLRDYAISALNGWDE